MSLLDYSHDPFLRNLASDKEAAVVERLQHWGLYTDAFVQRLDNWFCNFDTPEEKQLALKVFHSLKYYTPEAFTARLKQLYQTIERHLRETCNEPSDIVLVTPNGGADSADRHAYDVVKHWGLLRGQVHSLSELPQFEFEDPVFVLFNDTHGTGNQFLREVWPSLEQYGEHRIYVLAVAISRQALKAFREKMPRVHVIPHIPVESALTKFTGEECQLLQRIGQRVYAKHPMGYGNAALLTAYYFQCPNNTLPIIWADGDNNAVDGHAYSWSPLFPYLPKKKATGDTPRPTHVQRVGTDRVVVPTRKLADTVSGSEKPPSRLAYRYRVGLLDVDLGITNLPHLASALNSVQTFFHFTAPHDPDLSAPRDAVIALDGQRNLGVYGIGQAFFAQFDELAVDIVGCFTRYPLAFVNRFDGTVSFNYFSGPSELDSRFMFVSASQLRRFAGAAGCSFEEGLTHILVSQLVVYFTDFGGYHDETLDCPMDFCEIRSQMISGLAKRQFCDECATLIADEDEELLAALNNVLGWKPE